MAFPVLTGVCGEPSHTPLPKQTPPLSQEDATLVTCLVSTTASGDGLGLVPAIVAEGHKHGGGWPGGGQEGQQTPLEACAGARSTAGPLGYLIPGLGMGGAHCLALMISTNSGLSEAPPTRKPSTSGWLASSLQVAPVTEPGREERAPSGLSQFTPPYGSILFSACPTSPQNRPRPPHLHK